MASIDFGSHADVHRLRADDYHVVGPWAHRAWSGLPVGLVSAARPKRGLKVRSQENREPKWGRLRVERGGTLRCAILRPATCRETGALLPIECGECSSQRKPHLA